MTPRVGKSSSFYKPDAKAGAFAGHCVKAPAFTCIFRNKVEPGRISNEKCGLTRVGAQGSIFAVEFVQQKLGDCIEGPEYIQTRAGSSLKALNTPLAIIQQVFQEVGGRNVGKVALIKLEDIRHLIQSEVLLSEVLLQIAEALDVLLHLVPLRVGSKDDTVNVPEHKLPSRIIEHLAWNSVELKFCPEPVENDGVKW